MGSLFFWLEHLPPKMSVHVPVFDCLLYLMFTINKNLTLDGLLQ